jgi:hypothetical protein
MPKFVFKDVQEADYEFTGPFSNIKNYLNNLVKVAFFDAQDAENNLLTP